MFLNTFKHLLPHGARAWKLTINKKLRQFFDGLALGVPTDFKSFVDLVFFDAFPATTRELELWEQQFNLASNATLTEQERRDRLDGAWKAKGGQSPRYIQDTLQAAGFDVYVHEWWVPGTEPVLNVNTQATARDPFDYLTDANGAQLVISSDNNPDMQDGDALAQDGSTTMPTGYPLVNKYDVLDPQFIGDGALDMQDGDALAQDGSVGLSNLIYKPKEYTIPMDATKYPFFLYIGASTFPLHATIPTSRRNEFESLCLKICPTHLWLGMLIDYS